MTHDDSHLSDEKLLLDIDGELSKQDEKQVRTHLGACWNCRTRRAELEQAITEFIHVHRRQSDQSPPSPDGPRALLKARLAELASKPTSRRSIWFMTTPGIAWLTAGFVAFTLGIGLVRFGIGHIPRSSSYPARTPGTPEIVALPDSRLTPGATVLESRFAVCAEPDTKNKTVPAALRKEVFDEYGITGADPAAYEVDYLVTPALGGADDIHNLWPHSYAATAWNARVKDELEDRLRDMVCDGSLDLTAAQQEIATNWIAAYKKYFHTEKPLDRYCRRCTR